MSRPDAGRERGATKNTLTFNTSASKVDSSTSSTAFGAAGDRRVDMHARPGAAGRAARRGATAADRADRAVGARRDAEEQCVAAAGPARADSRAVVIVCE
jgi:hypothetical protein